MVNSTLEKKLEIKINPNPPNFKTTLANVIDPKTGASTWALGSHICRKKTGIFTNKEKKKEINYSVYIILLILIFIK